VAFAAGFASVRQCNDTVRQTFVDTPSGLRPGDAHGRRQASPASAGDPGHPAPPPLPAAFDPASVLDFLGLRALPGVEALDGASYTRSLRLLTGTASSPCAHPR